MTETSAPERYEPDEDEQRLHRDENRDLESFNPDESSKVRSIDTENKEIYEDEIDDNQYESEGEKLEWDDDRDVGAFDQDGNINVGSIDTQTIDRLIMRI